jgi:hypothetical protein
MRVLIVLLILFAAGCAKGTGTGNPYENSNPASGNTPLPVPANSVSGDVFVNVCMNIQRCHPEAAADSCDQTIEYMTTFGDKVGLGAGSTATVSEIILLEGQGQITSNISAGIACISAMNALSCTDSNMMAAFDAAALNPFANSPNILDPVCEQVFGH